MKIQRKIAEKGRAKFGPLAGLAQQFLFVMARGGASE
jgi:hypothetical protein